jgi:DNA repair photolyase
MDSNLGLLPGFDPAYISDSQSTNIKNRSNSDIEEDLDDSVDTTISDALTAFRKYRKKQKQRAKRKEKNMAELYHSTLVHHSQNLVPHSGDSSHNGNQMDSNLGLLPGSDHANISDSQPIIRYQSNSAMEEDFDHFADTTTTDALTTDTKLRQKLRRRAKQKDRRKIAWLQKSNLNTHDKDEMS